MKPYYDHAGITIYNGDCREILPTLEANSIHCCVTSPPYWGLRDYATGHWTGGDPACDHRKAELRRGVNLDKSPASTRSGSKEKREPRWISYSDQCAKCGALRQDTQIGLENSPEEYTECTVSVFQEVKRVLRPNGTLWLNLGDSYAATMRQSGPEYAGAITRTSKGVLTTNTRPLPPTLKEKDLVGIPWRVAFALQADGWYLRSDIIWSKPNPMPESVTDRPTKAHEYIFLLAKSEHYWYDYDAIKEHGDKSGTLGHLQGGGGERAGTRNGLRRAKSVTAKRVSAELRPLDSFEVCGNGKFQQWRNKRSVWTIPVEPFPEAHFATFPPALIEPCIKAGAPTGGTVLDPFGGAGTTAVVAKRFGNRAILIELNESYCEIAARRLEQEVFNFEPAAQPAAEQMEICVIGASE